MQFALVIVGAFLASLSIAEAKVIPQDLPPSVQSVLNLHRGPPIPLRKSSRAARVSTKWITQKLDHFDANETRTWQMRYIENDEHLQVGGPLIIYLGGEWEIGAGMVEGGILWDIAKEHKGILLHTEHRYYGQSHPTSDLSVENLKYLHVNQSLADLAHFIRTQRTDNPALNNSKVIVTGASYSASMVVWFRLLYPELLAGGWASSAPLLAKLDFKEYKEVVGQAFSVLGNEQCYKRIQNGTAVLEEMIANRKTVAEAKAMLKLCSNFDETNSLDVSTLFSSMANVHSNMVQTQSGNDVSNRCWFLSAYEDDVSAVAGFFVSQYANMPCLDMTYATYSFFYKELSYIYGVRPWQYQTCDAFGWYQSTASANQPFGSKIPASLFTSICHSAFGENYTYDSIQANVDRTNGDFGGLGINVTNVYMTHGGLDPWHPMGHGVAQGATIIPLVAHVSDFDSISATDSVAMVASKNKLLRLVREWLNDTAVGMMHGEEQAKPAPFVETILY